MKLHNMLMLSEHLEAQTARLGAHSEVSSEWSSVATCTEAIDVAVFINHTDRCRPQAQRGLNAPEPWACGYML